MLSLNDDISIIEKINKKFFENRIKFIPKIEELVLSTAQLLLLFFVKKGNKSRIQNS